MQLLMLKYETKYENYATFLYEAKHKNKKQFSI